MLTVDPNTGNISTTYNNHAYANSYVDAGTSVLVFGNKFYPVCFGADAGLYCPSAPQNLSATLQGASKGASTVSFSVANADQLFGANPSFEAFDNLAAPSGDSVTFAWGLPFFFGRSVYTAFEGRTTPGGTGPYLAF